jgi:hypothetical protein
MPDNCSHVFRSNKCLLQLLTRIPLKQMSVTQVFHKLLQPSLLQTHKCTHMHTRVHTQTNTHTKQHANNRTLTLTHTYTHVRTHTNAHTHSHTYTHTSAHTNKHTHLSVAQVFQERQLLLHLLPQRFGRAPFYLITLCIVLEGSVHCKRSAYDECVLEERVHCKVFIAICNAYEECV